MNNFFQKNKVFLLGMLGSVAVVLQQFIQQPIIDWKVVGFACFMTILSYVANAWRGQGTSILGILGTLAGTVVSVNQTGHFTWNQFLLSVSIAILAAVAPPPKSKEYENSTTIVAAKQEAAVIEDKNAQKS